MFGEQANPLAVHPRQVRGQRVEHILPGHRKKNSPVSYDVLLNRFADWGEEALSYAKEIRQRKRFARRELAHVLQLQRDYAAQDILCAIRHATRYLAFDAKALRRIVESMATPRTLEDRLAEKVKRHVKQTFKDSPIKQRDAKEYADLLGPRHVAQTSKENRDDEEKE